MTLDKRPKRKIKADLFAPASKLTEVVILPDTPVEVKLQMDDQTRKAWMLVSVKSLIRPGLWGHLKVDADSPRLEYLVQKAAETIAVQQCELYRDVHNPGAVAKAALEAFHEIKSLAEKARLNRGSGQ